MVVELVTQSVEQVLDREADELGMDGAGFELVDVEQRVEHARHGGGGFVEARNQGQRFLLLVVSDFPGQNAAHQAEGLQRLAKVVAGGGEEAGLGGIGLLGLALGGFQRVRCTPALGDVDEGDDDAFDPVVLGAIGQNPPTIPQPIPRLDFPFERR